jgi:hypothetical protein
MSSSSEAVGVTAKSGRVFVIFAISVRTTGWMRLSTGFRRQASSDGW